MPRAVACLIAMTLSVAIAQVLSAPVARPATVGVGTGPELTSFVVTALTTTSTTSTTVSPTPLTPMNTSPAPVITSPEPDTGSCGEILPPCWVMNEESGGSYTAVSPSSFCGGRGCYGKWQFDPTTSDYVATALGWPELVGVTADRWPPGHQDAGARWLWAGGAGCSHWNAC